MLTRIYLLLLVLATALLLPLQLQSQEEIKPNAAAGSAATAAANIKTAIQFLRDWSFANEADNIQKWFDDGKIFMDWDVDNAETSTTSGKISLNGSLLLGGENGNPGQHHKFDPADAKDKERIAELAFTLDHEKVHAHQSFFSFTYGREGNETDAYNKEINDADSALERMDDAYNKAVNSGDVAKQKQMLQWIGAVLEVKINAIVTFNDNYPESRKLNWPDRILDDLRELRKINDDRLRRFNVAVGEPPNTPTEFPRLLAQLHAFEQSLPVRTMPAYWMQVNNKIATPYAEMQTEHGIRTVVFHWQQHQINVSLPADMQANETISGSVKMEGPLGDYALE